MSDRKLEKDTFNEDQVHELLVCMHVSAVLRPVACHS